MSFAKKAPSETRHTGKSRYLNIQNRHPVEKRDLTAMNKKIPVFTGMTNSMMFYS